MVVFRCECEEVLGVDENSGDRLGECPSCGVIIRVPAAAANLKGRLSHKAAGAKSLSDVPVAAVAEPEPEIAEAVEVPAEVQEAAFDAEIADLRANTVPPEGHPVEEGLAKHSADEVSAPAEVEPVEVPQEVEPIETPQEVIEQPQEVQAAPEPVAEAEPEPVAEAPVEAVAEEPATEEAPSDNVPNKKKLSKRERLKLKKKSRSFEDAPVAEESAPVEAPVAEVSEEPVAAPMEEAPAPVEEPVAVAAEETPAEEPSAKSRSGLKSGIKKPMGLKGKAAIGAASGARKGVPARAKKEAPAEGDAPKKGKTLLFVIGAVVLVGALGGAFMLFKDKPADSGNGGGETKAPAAPSDEKKSDEAGPEAKQDAPKADAPADAPKADAPADAPKTDAPKSDAPADAPKADAPKAGTTGALPKEAPTAPAE